MQGIKDKVVVITGASSGLGEAAARLLAKDGAKLVLGARRLDRLRALSLILCVAISTAFTARRPRYPPGRSVSGAR
jgi:NADP-dependent 3-hydroxy acid dehydrogenase YdfG